MSDDLQAVARKFLLQNAVLHDGVADAKSTLGRVLGSHADLRPQAKALAAALAAAVDDINAMAPEDQQAELESLDPELMTVEKRARVEGLKPLKNVNGPVVLRFAPNPNGPLSFGHSRGVCILADYTKTYDAKVVLRLDDTDPQVKPALMDAARGWDGYKMVEEDFTWLAGRAPDVVVRASSEQEKYYQVARELIGIGGAYVCTLDAETWRERKNRGEPSPTRDLPPQAQLVEWDRMLAGEYAPGAAVLRVKTDMQHKDPALRDWVAFRIVATDAVHPRAKLGEIPDYRVWPLLDFQSAVEDHYQGVTHIIRGKDLMDSTRKQAFLYDHMGWTYPETNYWGGIKMHELGKFSTSGMRKAIEAGHYSGWDDVRLPTLRALARRGFSAKALQRFWVGLGISEKDIAVSMENLAAENSKSVESAERRFFVEAPESFQFESAESIVAHPAKHPSDPKLGTRELDPGQKILIAAKDVHKSLRLKDLGNVEIDGGKATFTDVELRRDVPIVQWLPAAAARPMTIFASGPVPEDAPDGFIPELLEHRGMAEQDVDRFVGQVVQFERVGFVRIESPDTAVWLHS